MKQPNVLYMVYNDILYYHNYILHVTLYYYCCSISPLCYIRHPLQYLT